MSATPGPGAVAAAWGLLVDRLTAELTMGLESRGVESILLKGPAVARWLYGEGELRAYSDCDLLVSPDGLPEAQNLLRDLGFHDHLDPLGHPRLESHSWMRNGQSVDLHTTLIGIGTDPATVWRIFSRMTERQPVGTTTVKVLDETARALHVALHAAQHGREERKPLEDLARALEKLPTERWAAVAALAEQLRATEAFATGLRLVPEGAALAAELDLGAARSTDASLRIAPVPLAQGFEHLATTQGVRARLRLILRELFPTPAFMHWWSPLARRGRLGLAAAYCWRPLWLAGRAVPGFRAWKQARRDAM